MANVFLAVPTYNGQLSIGTAQGACLWPTESRHRMMPVFNQSSLLANGFNKLWCQALNWRKQHGIDYFAMLHADLGPSKWWVDVLIDEMERKRADVCSVVVPIKDEKGTTSTGLDVQLNHSTKAVRRLTMTEVMDIPDETFGAEDTDMPDCPLLVNTGCWVCDFTKPWVEKVKFTITDAIGKDSQGEFAALSDPEDWGFSRQIHKLGLKAVATRKVQVNHYGGFTFTNDRPWGVWKRDETFFAALESSKGIYKVA